MNWFYNLKLQKKLLLSFILVAAIAGVIGFIGYSSLTTMMKVIIIYMKIGLSPLNN